MTILILGLIVFFIFLLMRKYKTVSSVITAVVLMARTTRSVAVWGLAVITRGSLIHFFNSSIGRYEFYYLMAAWYAADILCSAKIISNHIAYKKANYRAS